MSPRIRCFCLSSRAAAYSWSADGAQSIEAIPEIGDGIVQYVSSIAKAATVIGLAMSCTTTHAETRVQGTRDAVVIEAHKASVREVMEQLQEQFGIRFSIAPHTESSITGRYEGALDEVILRLLQRRQLNYVVERSDGVMNITVFGRRSTAEPGVVKQPDKLRSQNADIGFRKAPGERKKRLPPLPD